MLYSPILSFVRLIFFFFWTIICSTVQCFFIFLPNFFLCIIPKFYFKGLIFFFGIKVSYEGRPKSKNTLFVSNHTSYLDILILGAKLDGLFIAKSEIKGWPFINKLAKLRKTIFINREKKVNAKKQIMMINNYLINGFNLILFPEGTSNDGHRVLPFKSSLFAVIEENRNDNFFVQPISISYVGMDGLPLNRIFKPFFAWYGDMDLLPHVWKFLGLGSSEIIVTHHKPIPFKQFESRKIFSEHCFNIIDKKVSSDFINLKKISFDGYKIYKH